MTNKLPDLTLREWAALVPFALLDFVIGGVPQSHPHPDVCSVEKVIARLEVGEI